MSVVVNGTTGVSKTQPQSAAWLTGMIIGFGNITAPDGWLACDGTAVSRTTYAELFAAIGTKWGAGDGTTTFDLPDMREAAPTGIGTRGEGAAADVYTLGEFKDDQGQGHKHHIILTGGTANRQGGTVDRNIAAVQISDTYLDLTGTPGTELAGSSAAGEAMSAQRETVGAGVPRTGDTTHGKRVGVLYCIKT